MFVSVCLCVFNSSVIMCMCVHACVWACMQARVCLCVCERVCVHVHAHTHAPLSAYMCLLYIMYTVAG